MYGVSDEQATPPRRRLTRVEAKARTREQLLDAAAQVFARKGLAGASVDEIAEHAGYSTGALYSNFESKEQLFLELLAARRTKGIARQAAVLTEAMEGGADPVDALTGFLERVTDRSAEFAALQAEFWLYAVRNPEAMRVVAAKSDEQVEALEPITGRLLESLGADPQVAPEDATRVILGLFQGLAYQRRIDPDAVSGELLAQALRWLIAGMRAPD